MPEFDMDDFSARRVRLGGEDIYVAYENPFTTDPVRGHIWRAEGKSKGEILFCPGFTEFCEKYGHVAARLVASGYDVLLIDWPGQGRSGHFGQHLEHIHLDDFETHLKALDALLAHVKFKAGAIVMGNSMGGHLALRAAHRYGELFSRIILSAPMIRPLAGPTDGVRLLGRILSSIGRSHKRAPFQIHLPTEIARQAGSLNFLTHDPESFDVPYQIYEEEPALRRAVPTVGWVRAAYRSCAQTSLNAKWISQIHQPVLAFLAEQEYIVSTQLSQKYLSKLPDGHIEIVAGARHEILNELPEINAHLWPKIFKFLEAKD